MILPVYFFSLIIALTGCSSKEKDSLLPQVASSRNSALDLGFPAFAGITIQDSNRFFIQHSTFALSYNSSKGTPNWVAWHLNNAWIGSSERSDNFKPDPLLPNELKKINTSYYTNSGFDRGHVCPSADRTKTEEENLTTFYLSNIVPQTPNLNRITWKNLEEYCRDLVSNGYELYIYAGPFGQGGVNASGDFKNTIYNGEIVVPSHCWKIILALSSGENDLQRIDSTTKILSAFMPNNNAIDKNYSVYITNVDEIERITGFNFFNELPNNIEDYIENKTNFILK